MRYHVLGAALALTLAVGCAVPPPPDAAPSTTSPAPVASTPVPPRASATPTPTLTPTPSPTLEPSPESPPKDTRKGRQLAKPFEVDGIIVVSKKHRITASYGPSRPTGPYRLEAKAAAALTRMMAAAKADGVPIRVRSGHRTWATQSAIYAKALRNYPQSIGYYAPAGASEHQTGLAVDLWDGATWSLPMASTAAGKWLFRNARTYGFILRYPQGKTKITGYQYEPWHYRYIGRAASRQFPNNKLTLEEYLGLA